MAKTRIKSIPVTLAKPGMVVAREVLNPEGQVSLQAGTVLLESSISGLIRRNTYHVSVFQEDERSEEELQVERAKTTERINYLFRHVPQDGTMGALRQMILACRLDMLS